MTTRLFAGLVLAATFTASATALASAGADDHSDAYARRVAREVRQAVQASLRDVHREVRAAVREARLAARAAVREAHRAERGSGPWQRDRDEREAARERTREARTRDRAARDRERDARAFRQVSPTDDPCAEQRGSRDRGHACEVRDSRVAAPGSALTVDAAPNGGIRVEGWDQPDVLVRAVVRTWADDDAAARDLLSQVRVNAGGSQVGAEGPDRTGGRRGWSVS